LFILFLFDSNAHEKVPVVGKPPLLRARTLPSIIVPRLNITAPVDEKDPYDGPFGNKSHHVHATISKKRDVEKKNICSTRG
jgi:hypothetical protein